MTGNSPIAPSGFGAGHTAQYITLAEALRLARESLEHDLGECNARKIAVPESSIRFEARISTICLLAAALSESVANTILATLVGSKAFEKLRMHSTHDKWTIRIPVALSCPPPSLQLANELKTLFALRASLMHAKATIFGENHEIVVKGDDHIWAGLTVANAKRFASLPYRLTAIVPDSADIVLSTISISLRERIGITDDR